MLLLTAICSCACLVLAYAEYRALAWLRIASKLLASAAFVGVGMANAGDSRFAGWMLVGLVLGATGDAALLGHGPRWFLAGLVAFLLGHVAYVVGLAQLVDPSRWISVAGVPALLPISAGAIVLSLLWCRLGDMRGPVIGYVVVIVLMVIGAIAMFRAHAMADPARTRLLAGTVLFFVSDVAVARDRFVAEAFVNRLWGLPAYYAGQLLIAWSIA